MDSLGKRPQFRFLAHRHWPWLTAGLVLCSAVWLAFFELPMQRTRDGAAVETVRLLEAQLRAQDAVTVAPPQDLARELADFETLSLVMNDLQALTAQNGMQLLDATFKQAGETTAYPYFGRVEVNARIKGSYRPLKKTLAALLATHAGLALESLSLRRGLATDVVLDIDLRFTYFYRKPS